MAEVGLKVSAESSNQVVQIQGGAKLLGLLDKLGSMEAVIERSTAYINNWEPLSNSKAELTKARNAKDYMKIIADTWKSCQAIEMKTDKRKADGDLFGGSELTDNQIRDIAKILNQGEEKGIKEVIADEIK